MSDIIDLDRYPLDRPESADWTALVASARADLARDGMFNLPDFVRPQAIKAAAAALMPRFDAESFRHARSHNIYFRKEVPGIAPDHPALRQFETISRTLCGDQIGGAVQHLYEWPEFARFLAAVMSKPALFTMDDPLARINAMAYGPGEALNWHFDRSEFTTTLLLQAPEAGGAFEYRSDLRSDAEPNYEGVARLLAGEEPELRRLTLAPGTLNVFKGRNTAHRVTPVEGQRARIITVFSFYDRPGVCFSDEERIGFYGRAA
ncbi:MAG: 2OG-Fe(II) oxygenase [Rhodobacterales bacterium 32-67-9]|nr:MAG: 2OG-Fe(II) oxygenase [Rhodobacterales bacterium 32-67-9]